MKIQISNNFLVAQINSKGAELTSLKKNDKEFMWNANPKFWAKHAPILFPIVGTLKNDNYTFKNKSYSLTRHGFARDNEFSVKEKSENSVTFSLESSDETLKMYPFDFELNVTFTLEDSSLKTKYQVVNNSKSQMPFSIGGHPAFTLSENFENYSLKFDGDFDLEVSTLEKDLISDKKYSLKLTNSEIQLNYQLFENDALIFKNIHSKKIQILENGKPHLEINFKDFPDLGIWTKNNAPFICIEPWFGYSDDTKSSGNISEKEGIQLLNEGEIFEAKFEMHLF